MKLTDNQRKFLASLPADGGWRFVSINRSGANLHMASVRQQCRKRGLAESDPEVRRRWRITPAGRTALSGER